jgi:hypothetical protein
MAWTRLLLDVAAGHKPVTRRRCWPGENDRPDARPGGGHERRCWPDASDLPRGEITPREAIKKIARGRWI